MGVRPGSPDRRGEHADELRLAAEAWVRAAGEGGAVGATVWDGYAAMQVADAAARSIESGNAEAVPDEPRPALYDPV